METNNFKLIISKGTKLLLPAVLLFTMGFAHQVSAISTSIGDPVEIFSLWTSVRSQATAEYNLLKQNILIGKTTGAEAQFNNLITLIQQLDSLSAKFTGLIKSEDKNTLSVIYPNGGETFECAKNYTIIWKTKISPNQIGIDNLINPTFGIYLSATDESGRQYISKTIATKLTIENNKYDWLVPCDIRAGSYYMRIVGNPETKITSFEDYSDASFSITSNVVKATIESLSIDKTNVASGEKINMNWTGNNVKEYRLFFGTEFGTGVSMEGKAPTNNYVHMGLQTSASFIYTNASDVPQKVFVMLEAFGGYESKDSSKQVEITISPKKR